MSAPLLRVDDVTVDLPLRRGWSRRPSTLTAVDGASLSVHEGTTTGLVGESGSGKTTLGLAIVGSRRPSAGRILFDGHDIAAYRGRDLQRYRRDVQIIFQDPADALNPRMTLRQIVAEPMLVHGLCESREERDERSIELLQQCGIPRSMIDQHPHALSGGQKQRAAIARALACQPRLIIADEPTSALDVSVQAQIIRLLHDLRQAAGIAFLFISHDLGVIRQVADDVSVMSRGRIVESGPTAAVFARPADPCTRRLLDAHALPERRRESPAGARAVAPTGTAGPGDNTGIGLAEGGGGGDDVTVAAQ